MNLETIIAIVVVIALVGLVALRVATRGAGAEEDTTASGEPRTGPLSGASEVVDASIGMYLVRRLFGRRRDDAASPEARAPEATDLLDAEAIAYRIGAAGSPARSTAQAESLPPPALGGAAETAAVVRAAAARTTYLAATYYGPDGVRLARGVAPTTTVAPAVRSAEPRPWHEAAPAGPRVRLLRDSGMALLLVAIFGLIAMVAWNPAGSGSPTQSVFGVVPGEETPEASAEPDSESPQATAVPAPSGVVAAETDVPATSSNPVVGGSQPPPIAPASSPTPTPARLATPRPTPTPTPTRAATPLPTATIGASPSPVATATPAPTPSATPIPEPSATPIPEPSATPIPEPSATPTPDPSPS